MNVLNRLVFIVEDDDSLRTALEAMLNACGYQVRAVSTAEQLLSSLSQYFNQVSQGVAQCEACCILMDVGLTGMNGIEAQLRVKNMFPHIPIIFMSGAADIHSVNQAWRDGAYNFIFKPFQTHELIVLLGQAFEKYRQVNKKNKEFVDSPEGTTPLPRNAEDLTPREIQVLQYVAEGNKNQAIADALGISLRTVKMHRANLMRKLECTHVAELVRFYEGMRGVS